MADQILQTLARYATDASDELSGPVRSEVARRYADSFACAFQAFEEVGPVTARRYAAARHRQDGVAIWGTSDRVDPETAALVNGAAVRYLDLNDSFFSKESLHPSDMLAPILAAAEDIGAGGREVVVASAVAYEVAMTLCHAFCVHCHGWDHTNVTGLGACAGVGRLLGLDADTMAHALSLQITPHAAMRQTRYGDLSMWKGFAAADAGRQAIYACALAVAGVEGPAEPFEGRYGFISQLLEGEEPDRQVIASLEQGHAPELILDSHIKFWPLGYVAQSAVEAASMVRDQLPDVDAVDRIDVTTFAEGLEFMSSPEKWRPRTRETADHSLPYAVAEMIRRGRVDAASFAPERFGTEETHRYLKEKVFVEVDDGFSARYGPEFPVRVRVTTTDGKIYEQELSVSTGHAKRPLTSEQLADKFHAGADEVLGPERAAEALATTLDLEHLDDVGGLIALLTR